MPSTFRAPRPCSNRPASASTLRSPVSRRQPARLSLLAAVATLVSTLGTACNPGPSIEEPPAPSPESTDVHSAARPGEVAVEHLVLDLEVDFDAEQLVGRASHTLARTPGSGSQLVLDTHGLDIRNVTLDDGKETGYRLGVEKSMLGRSLSIDLLDETRVVHVDYATSPDAAALQWLSPAQTAGGEHPYLFTQSQAILARTWVPCQDTPSSRFTYEATIRVPPELMAVMSAENPQERSADGVYHFSMPQPIPSYLLALAVGDLQFRALGERTGVYSEPSMLEAAAWELAETEAMMEAVEPLYGPYQWGRFDVLVLPPSFPFGGMENPRLTFATPTILAGDRSLVALIAHELAHSWSGNLVTNATWNDFWLNEGFTVYLERRIMEATEGKDYAAMLARLGLGDLRGTLEGMEDGSRDSHLFLDLEGRDPDDGMTDVAYEKGYFFLRMIEETVGRESFDPFLRRWFDENAFVSRTTDDFVRYLEEELIAGDDELARKLQVDAWIYGPGLPVNLPEVESDAFSTVDARRTAWLDGTTAAADLDVEGWTTHHWLHFVRGLPAELDRDRMAELDAAFGFGSSGNSEILAAWMQHVIANRYEPSYDALADFLERQGRRKFLRPLYQAMAEREDLRPMAVEIYERARPGYHPVSVGTIDQVLDWPAESAG